jgi:hypothetical protein
MHGLTNINLIFSERVEFSRFIFHLTPDSRYITFWISQKIADSIFP